ncbi:hypothetical protein GOP47_0022980 [Adiantum capillus-veneris]|uniref:BHLH domain-containing protein n=1 Tax=Adiantum capillus-veneris TaxID=13818 RepID=A0A9D4Z7E4_ADICA|nr:hypothetical protein GOP47_0022980 [Adiantum capillus-veneris]
MPEHEIQGNSTAVLPFAVAMEEEQGQSCSLYSLPQALAMAASPGLYSSSTAFTTAHEQGFSYAADHENIPKVENFARHNHTQVYEEPNNNMGCITPSLPLWANNMNAESLVGAPLNEQNINYLLSLQGLLKCQYGIFLTLDQLLAFDALPALLQPESDPQLEPYNEDHDLVRLELPPPSIITSHPAHPQVHEVAADHVKQAACLPATIQETSACVSPILMNHLCINEAYRAQDISSPGSAASSSVVTESENGEKVHLHAEYVAPTSNLLAQDKINQSWIDPSISWISGAGQKSSALQALRTRALEDPCERPSQRRKLQEITLEQVLQAEKLQVSVGTIVMQPISACDTSLMEVTNGRDVPASSLPGMRRGSLAGMRDLQAFRERSHEIPHPLPQPKRPVSTSVEPQSIAARHRRQRIKEKTEALGMIIPGATRLDTAGMFDLAIKYVHFLQAQMMCLENEVSFSSRQKMMSYEDESVSGFRRALIHRLLSSQDVQHFLSKEGLCLVTESLASRLNYDGINDNTSVLSKRRAALLSAKPDNVS